MLLAAQGWLNVAAMDTSEDITKSGVLKETKYQWDVFPIGPIVHSPRRVAMNNPNEGGQGGQKPGQQKPGQGGQQPGQGGQGGQNPGQGGQKPGQQDKFERAIPLVVVVICSYTVPRGRDA